MQGQRLVGIGGWVVAALVVIGVAASKYEIGKSQLETPPLPNRSSQGESRTRGGSSTQKPAIQALSTEEIFRKANLGVVLIQAMDEDGQTISQGSGFVASQDGLIVTNYHVIRGAASALVRLSDGGTSQISGIVGFDRDRDVAVLKSQAYRFKPLELGDSRDLQVGQKLVCIGSPLGLQNSLTEGVVSAIRGEIVQMSTPISPGSSGGPVFDTKGKVVGIAVASIRDGQNLNFAVPIAWVQNYLSSSSLATSLGEISKQNRIVDHLLDQTVSIPAGQALSWTFVVDHNRMTKPELAAKFVSKGGVGDNVRLLVLRDGSEIRRTERVSAAELKLVLSDGRYQIVLDNRESLMFARQVTADFQLRYVK